VFLWPENWLEPELRDDKSPFFTEAMSELVQGDITEDAAARTLIRYLTKLEEVAQLEPSGMYLRENSAGTADDVVHVVAHTAGARRAYYHRRRSGGSWTPWDAIKLDIEDDPVIPVLWGDRLFAFWLRILTQSPAAVPTTGSESSLGSLSLQGIKQDAAADVSSAKLTVQAILCWSEYANGSWQPPKTSAADRPLELGEFPQRGPGAFDRSSLRLGVGFYPFALQIVIAGSGRSFLLFNSYSAPVRGDEVPPFEWPFPIVPRWRSVYRDGDTLVVSYMPSWMPGGITPPPTPQEHKVLKDSRPFRAAEPLQLLGDPWGAPFLFADSLRTYWVTPTSETVTLPASSGFGVVLAADLFKQVEVPRVWLRRDPRKDGRPPADLTDGRLPGFGVTDPAELKRFVANDRNIHATFLSPARVRYGDRDIGPSGAMPPDAGRRG
jgi:hypothetical protein